MNLEPAVDGPRRPLLRVSLLFATFMAYSAWQAPVPGVNEPHYLTKARHYWQPEWCAGDLFLESSNAHLLFYQTVGWLTAVCTLEQAAWCGRILGCLLLAVGWEHFIGGLVATRFGSLWTAWLFLLLQTIGNFSGEWLVGGVEAKVFSYAFLFWGCGRLLRGHALGAAAAFGLAVSMHPVVGGWSVLSAVVATALTARTRSNPELHSLLKSLRLPQGLVPAGVFGLLCLPGLIPAAQLLLDSNPELVRRANFIQFTYRLSHHLDPQAFSDFAYGYYAVMIVTWLALVVVRTRRPTWLVWPWSLNWFQWLVATSLVVAVAGCLLGLGPRPLPPGDLRLTLLKFYPFRLADILVPLLLSVLVVRLAERFVRPPTGHPQRSAAVFAGFGIAGVAALLIPGQDRNPSGMNRHRRAQWIEVCRWVRDETAADSVIYAVHEDWALRWYCQRPVYVSFKDCPQDAAGIVEWYDRQRYLTEWSRRAFVDGIADPGELQQLHETTGISYLISREFSGLDTTPLYHNETFYVYGVGREHSGSDDRGD